MFAEQVRHTEEEEKKKWKVCEWMETISQFVASIWRTTTSIATEAKNIYNLRCELQYKKKIINRIARKKWSPSDYSQNFIFFFLHIPNCLPVLDYTILMTTQFPASLNQSPKVVGELEEEQTVLRIHGSDQTANRKKNDHQQWKSLSQIIMSDKPHELEVLN